MPSSYTLNNGIELIATGEQSGSWGTTTNTNLSLIDTSLDGQITITLPSAGSSGSPNSLPINDGVDSNGRNRFIIFNDGGDLGASAYVQLTPNDAEKIIYIRNALSGSRSILVFQGTYNASNDYEVPAGKTAVIHFDGAGTGAVAANVFNNAHFDALNIVGAVSAGSMTLGGALSAGSLTLTTDLAVAEGGTGASDAATARTNLGLAIGTDVQAYSSSLDDFAGLTATDGNFIVGDGANFVTESGSTARTSLGLGTIATQSAASVSITGGSISGITDLAVADGGTGASDAATARTNLSAAASGANSDITSLSGLTTPLSVAQGGTGATTLTANNVVVGNGTSAPNFVAPGTSGNILTSNGTTWTSTAPAASGGFDAGTKMAFNQTAAPTGWTKDTTAAINDSILRLVTGTATSGGATGFSTYNGATTTGAHTLSTAQIPSHSHTYQRVGTGEGQQTGQNQNPFSTVSTGAAGSGGSHTHTLTKNIKFYDFIIASKD